MEDRRNLDGQNRDNQPAKPDPVVHLDERGGLSSTGATSTDDPQPSALGGNVATRSGTGKDQKTSDR